MNTTKTAAVRQLMTELEQFGDGAIWSNTGGGCHAIELPLADGGYLLITDAEDVFFDSDIDSDENVSGFCMGRYDAAGDLVEPIGREGQYHFLSDVKAVEYTLGSDIPQVVAAVRAVIDGEL